MSRLYISLLFYSVIGFFLYIAFDGKIFEYLFTLGLENILKFIFVGNEHGLLRHIKLADRSFFFIYFAIYFIFLGIYLIINQKKLIFSNNYYLSSREKVFKNLKKMKYI